MFGAEGELGQGESRPVTSVHQPASTSSSTLYVRGAETP